MSGSDQEHRIGLEYALLKDRYGDLLSAADDEEMTKRLSGFAAAVRAIRAYPLTNGDTPQAAPESNGGRA